MREVGKTLKILRESVKLSQIKIGELMGLRQSSVNRYENGQAEAPYKVLLWYADYFDVSLDYVFGRCEKLQGRLYDYQPKMISELIEKNEELKQFIAMCIEPNSSMNERLKHTLMDMVKGGEK